MYNIEDRLFYMLDMLSWRFFACWIQSSAPVAGTPNSSKEAGHFVLKSDRFSQRKSICFSNQLLYRFLENTKYMRNANPFKTVADLRTEVSSRRDW